MILRYIFLALLTFFFSSCAPKPQLVLFPVQGAAHVLYGIGREAAEGKLDFSKPKKVEYRFSVVPAAVRNGSFEIEYSATGDRSLALNMGTYSWVLPQGGDYGGDGNSRVHYAIPIEESFPDYFSIAPAEPVTGTKNNLNRIQIHSVKLNKRWYGFYRLQDSSESAPSYEGAPSSEGVPVDHIYISPFITKITGALPVESSWVIEPPSAFDLPSGLFPVLEAALPKGNEAVFIAGNNRFTALPRLEHLNIPAGIIEPNDSPLILSGDRISFFRLACAAIQDFPAPITADPGLVLAWPRENWRDAGNSSRYEVFRWEQFPSLLIFDTADYKVQDRMLKRLAFFVEKAGFRGRLAADREIEELHGWNAHDYRAEDLARFFQTARVSNFPLLAEERELERICLNTGIIRETGTGIVGGDGGIISISRESPEYLRHLFLAHEAFHGIFFIDEDFREFSRRRWRQLGAEARRFIISYFNFQGYDTSDEYLLVNEFMGHIMQQSVSQASYYFGQVLPLRIEEHPWRRHDLPAKDPASGTWPILAAAFTREAQAFSEYVNSRWGLSAGRVYQITVKPHAD